MIDTILTIVKTLIAILPFVLLSFYSEKINLSKTDRSKQFPMPVIALVYAVASMLLLNKINVWLLKLIERIPKWIANLADFSWMPDVVSKVIVTISEYVEKFIESFNLNFWIFFISNVVIYVVYLIIKKFCLKIIEKAIKTDSDYHIKISSKFYEFFPETSKWFIRENFVQVRGMLQVFYFTAIGLSSLLMLVSRKLFFDGYMKSIFYPVFGIIVLGEVYFYLAGSTKREETIRIFGENEDAYKTVNYSLLRKFLRSVFGDKLLNENTSINSDLSYDITTEEVIRGYEDSDDPVVANFATYVNKLNKLNCDIDHNYLQSSLDLLEGKSILFNNPFYNDLTQYAFYPMNRTLLSHQKVLIILGRHSIEDDIKSWIERGIELVTNIPFLWNIEVLKNEPTNADIGIITRSDVLNIELQNANSEFLENVGFCVIIEPSKLITTAQIGLNIIAKKCRANENKKVVYCLCDKNCDGLVDAMSHVLMTDITEVTATEKHRGTSSYMCWDADGEYLHHRLVPNISRYLGIGTELSFAALKNQVSKTTWYGGDVFPVTDIRWISKQYYYDLTKYANIPTSQELLDDYFVTTSNFWSAETEKYSYMTVEDEAYNMFEILRDFSTRTTEQGFVNVISSEYLLKDYMADNATIFETDAKAIPLIVADYTRSNRNTILRLVLMMSTYPVKEDVLEKELSLLGITVFDLKRQLWYELYHCFTGVATLADLPEDYKTAVKSVYLESLKINGLEWTNKLIKICQTYNVKSGKMETTYSITDKGFISACVVQLRSAGYIAEDEKGEKYYLGSELSGHIYQKYLPGQFFTFAGKYYEMQYLTADGQVLVRRAAEHITGRPSYRQIRNYVIHDVIPSNKIGACKNVGGVKVVKEFADISVQTSGYYQMDKYNDFETAKTVSFESGKNGIPERTYRNKEILRIELPDFEGKLNDNVKYTMTMLFNEIFRTIFAENQPYICAVTDCSFLENAEEKHPLTYSLEGEGYEVQKQSIYIIEDSQLDLGLVVTVERNLNRIFSIMHDYIDWHFETLENSLVPPPDPVAPIVFTDEPEEDPKKKNPIKKATSAIANGFKKLGEKIKGLFKKKKKKDENPEDDEKKPTGGDGAAADGDGATGDGSTGDGSTGDGTTGNTGDSEVKPSDGTEPVENGEEEILDPKEKKKREKQAKKEKKKLEKEKKENLFKKLGNKIKGIFSKKGKKKKDPGAEDGTEGIDEIIGDNGDVTDGTTADDGANGDTDDVVGDAGGIAEADDVITDDNSDEANDEGVANETFKEENSPMPNDEEVDNETEPESDDEQAVESLFADMRKPYHERYYMLFGRENEFSFVDLKNTMEYLAQLGMERNPLKQARESKNIAEMVEATFKPGRPDARYCDFCGNEIYGVEYETLADGRDRCLGCGRTAIKTGDEFCRIFEDVRRNMESFFGIKLNVSIKVEMVNSRKLHKRLGKAYIPTPKADGRVLGVAISDKDGYTLLVENGSPRMASMLTMAHELTHIWQYENWKDKDIRKKYGKAMRLEIYEGMAKWAEIQYAYLINEPAVAKREEIMTAYRDDEYGHGFLRYRANYPFSLGTVITKPTPFMYPEEPLDSDFCGAFKVVLPTDGVNPGDIGNGKKPTGKEPVLPIDPIQGEKKRDPSNFPKYAYELLNDVEKTVYTAVLDVANNFGAELDCSEFGITEEQIKKILDYMHRDHPEIFWLRHGSTFYFDTTTHIVSRVEFVYCMSQDEAKKRKDEIDVAVNAFMSQVNDTMSDYEVTLRIYENIIKLVDYDTIGLDRQKSSKGSVSSPEVPDDLRSIYGVFVQKKAVCAGYAKATQYLLNLCGIECTYVTSETHAWNLVKLEGDYYHLDVTWGDGSNTKKDKNQTELINYTCFCITTEEVLRLDSHTPEDLLPLPECTATKCNYYVRHGLYFEKFDLDQIRSVVCESVEKQNFDISLKFGKQEAFAEAKKQLVDNHKFRDVIQYSNLKSETRVDTSYIYSVSDDKYIITLRLKKL